MLMGLAARVKVIRINVIVRIFFILAPLKTLAPRKLFSGGLYVVNDLGDSAQAGVFVGECDGWILWV